MPSPIFRALFYWMILTYGLMLLRLFVNFPQDIKLALFEGFVLGIKTQIWDPNDELNLDNATNHDE